MEEVNKFQETIEQVIEQEKQENMAKFQGIDSKLDEQILEIPSKLLNSDELESRMRGYSQAEFAVLKQMLDMGKDDDAQISQTQMKELQDTLQK